MDTLRINFNQITLNLSYKATISFCNTNKQFRPLCDSVNYWIEKAEVNYDFDLSKMGSLRIGANKKYERLEEIMKTDIHTLFSRKTKLTTYMWNKKLEQDYGVADIIGKSTITMRQLIDLVTDIEALAGTSSNIPDTAIITFLKSNYPNIISHIVEYGFNFNKDSKLLPIQNQADIAFFIKNVDNPNIFQLLSEKIVLNEKRYADMIFLLNNIALKFDDVNVSLSDLDARVPWKYVKQLLDVIEMSGLDNEGLMELVEDDVIPGPYKTKLLNFVRQLDGNSD